MNRPQRPIRWNATAPALVVGLSVLSPAAQAAEWFLRLDTSFGRNSNVFQTPDAQDGGPDGAPPVVSTRERQQIVGAGVAVPLGSDDTRLVLTTEWRARQWANVEGLNHNGPTWTVALPWRQGPLWEGSIEAGRQVFPFQVDNAYRRLDEVRRSWQTGRLSLRITPDIDVPVVVSRLTLAHEDRPVHGRLDEQRSTWGAGVRYRSPLGHALAAGAAKGDVRYPERSGEAGLANASRLTDTDVYLDLAWVPSTRTRVGARWVSRARAYPDQPALVSRLNLLRIDAGHALSPLTRMDLQAWRRVVETDDPGLLYGLTKGAAFSVGWQATPKTLATVQLSRDAQTDVPLGNDPLTRLNNLTTRRLAFRVQHAPVRGVLVYAETARENRSGDLTARARQNVFSLGLTYSYESRTGSVERVQPSSPPEP